MTLDQANRLVLSLSAYAQRWGTAPANVSIQGLPGNERLVFWRGAWGAQPSATHSIAVATSDEARCWAHLRGFIGLNPGLPREGTRVTFTRGMFGRWSGTVAKVGHRRLDGRLFLYVTFTRRSGSRGTYRPLLSDCTWA